MNIEEEDKNHQEAWQAYIQYEYLHSWFTQYPDGKIKIMLKSFMAENAEA